MTIDDLKKTPKYRSLSQEVKDIIERLSDRFEIYLSDKIDENLLEWRQSDYIMFFNSRLWVWYKPHINSYKTSQSIGANREIYVSGAYEFLSEI